LACRGLRRCPPDRARVTAVTIVPRAPPRPLQQSVTRLGVRRCDRGRGGEDRSGRAARTLATVCYEARVRCETEDPPRRTDRGSLAVRSRIELCRSDPDLG